jgi:hypothetical protein
MSTRRSQRKKKSDLLHLANSLCALAERIVKNILVPLMPLLPLVLAPTLTKPPPLRAPGTAVVLSSPGHTQTPPAGCWAGGVWV